MSRARVSASRHTRYSLAPRYTPQSTRMRNPSITSRIRLLSGEALPATFSVGLLGGEFTGAAVVAGGAVRRVGSASCDTVARRVAPSSETAGVKILLVASSSGAEVVSPLKKPRRAFANSAADLNRKLWSGLSARYKIRLSVSGVLDGMARSCR